MLITVSCNFSTPWFIYQRFIHLPIIHLSMIQNPNNTIFRRQLKPSFSNFKTTINLFHSLRMGFSLSFSEYITTYLPFFIIPCASSMKSRQILVVLSRLLEKLSLISVFPGHGFTFFSHKVSK